MNRRKHTPAQCDLEGLVSCDERREPRQALLPRPSHPDQQGVSLWRPQDAWDPHQVDHRVLSLDHTEGHHQLIWTKIMCEGEECDRSHHHLEEDQVHGSASHRLVVLLLKSRQPLCQKVQWWDWLVHLSIISVSTLRNHQKTIQHWGTWRLCLFSFLLHFISLKNRLNKKNHFNKNIKINQILRPSEPPAQRLQVHPPSPPGLHAGSPQSSCSTEHAQSELSHDPPLWPEGEER